MKVARTLRAQLVDVVGSPRLPQWSVPPSWLDLQQIQRQVLDLRQSLRRQVLDLHQSVHRGVQERAERARTYAIERVQWMRQGSVLTIAVTALVLVATVAAELRISALQSVVIPVLASQLTWRLDRGASSKVVYPRSGPFDVASGYSNLPAFQRRLTERGFRVVDQTRFSSALALAAAVGVTPPSRDKALAGLLISDERGDVEYNASARFHRFPHYDDVPPVIVESLLYMEDRRLLGPARPSLNAAVDIGRLARAAVFSAGSQVGLPFAFQGGSTLAVQMEKYRHSESGRTSSPLDKLRQIISASLRVYQDGPDTRKERREIILDYVNTVPLGGVRGYGEVHGLGEGLRAWFEVDPAKTFDALEESRLSAGKTRALKQVLALLCAVRAPTRFLGEDRPELERRLAFFERELYEAGVIEREQFLRLTKAKLEYPTERSPGRIPYESRKGVDLVRRELLTNLGLSSLNDLDRLDLEVTTTLDARLQHRATRLLREFATADFADSTGLVAPHLLASGDPSRIRYSLLLIERTPSGDLIRVNADNLEQPFDLNSGMRMELGSTAKLRTLAHYLQVVERLYDELSGDDPKELKQHVAIARDPLTRWAAAELIESPGMPLDSLLDHALERRYSATPYETFFTGGGLHSFSNFDPEDNGRKPSVRQALAHSTNLVFIRLMRDLVRYHEARLTYDAKVVLSDPADPVRKRMLEEIVDEEGRDALTRAYKRFEKLEPAAIPEQLLGRNAGSNKHWAILYWAWNRGAPSDSMAEWLADHGHTVRYDDAQRMAKLYDNPKFTLQDYAYLLGCHPLDIWAGQQMTKEPSRTWQDLLLQSEAARKIAGSWLLDPNQRRAQNLRLRTRIERDAFERMTADWRQLGFPFERLVPSYATSIGSSADRPGALAALMGIIVNGGVRKTPGLVRDLRFGGGTPYETVIAREESEGERVMSASVANTLRDALTGVVEKGTARRVRGVFQNPDGTVATIGGKTGSGDNRVDSYAAGGRLIRSRAVSRTAAFVFYVGDRYYGVVTALVNGPRAADYVFTSALPLEVLRRFAAGMGATPTLGPVAMESHDASAPPPAAASQ